MSPRDTIAAAVAKTRRVEQAWAAHRRALEMEWLRAEGVAGQAAIARALIERELPDSVFSALPFRIRLRIQRYAAREDGCMDDDYKLVFSTLSKRVTRDGITVDVQIYRGKDEEGWLLEVVDHLGGSTVWDDRFATDVEALQEAMVTIEAEGIASFAAAEAESGPPTVH
jgi:hypothetical protein